jgi:hypothetical protein
VVFFQIVASAPGYPQGAIDPIEELGRLDLCFGDRTCIDDVHLKTYAMMISFTYSAVAYMYIGHRLRVHGIGQCDHGVNHIYFVARLATGCSCLLGS